MSCQNCGKDNPPEARFCQSCGAELQQSPVVPQPILCKACGNPIQPGEKYCSKCFVLAPAPTETPKEWAPAPIFADTKENRIIRAKIATKNEEMDNISNLGPILVGVLGFLFCITIIGIIPGLIIIGFAIWWNSSRNNEMRKLKSEIKELEAELS